MIVVTGGAGFIGTALIAELNRRGKTDILVVDDLGTGTSWKNLRALSFSDYMEKADFLDLVIDGVVAGEYLTELRRLLEDPVLLLA